MAEEQKVKTACFHQPTFTNASDRICPYCNLICNTIFANGVLLNVFNPELVKFVLALH